MRKYISYAIWDPMMHRAGRTEIHLAATTDMHIP